MFCSKYGIVMAAGANFIEETIMSVQVGMLDTEPIIQAIFEDPYDDQGDLPRLLAAIKRLRDVDPRRVVVLLDLTEVMVASDRIALALAHAVQQIYVQQPLMPCAFVFVAPPELVGSVAQAMGRMHRGRIGGDMFITLEAALERACDIVDTLEAA
jgi:hypothetical protein